MLARITGGVHEWIAENSESPEHLVLALQRLGLRVELQQRGCNCGRACGYVLGEVSAGYYVADVWVFRLMRFQWWPCAAHTLAEAQLDALERMILALVRGELVAAPAPSALP